MKTRQQIYSQEAASILRDVTMYHSLMETQLLRLYPGKEDKVKNLLNHLVRQGRILYDEATGFYHASEEYQESIDRGLLSAVWVLIDFIDQVEFHSVCEFPGKIIFFANAEVYEIIYVTLGQETPISHLLSNRPGEPPRYIVLVDKPEQIADLQIPEVRGYCTVAPDGTVQYYQKE